MEMKPRIAILDDYHGISINYFNRFGWSVTVFRDTLSAWHHPATQERARKELVRRLQDFDVICTMRERTPIPAELIEQLPNLKLLLTTGARNASIDLAACAARGIPVAGTPLHPHGVATATIPETDIPLPDSTTEHCVGMIMALTRGIARDDNAVRCGHWQTGWSTCISGKTLGVVGLGRLGTSVARILRVAFGMKLIAWSENLTQERADEQARKAGLPVTDQEGNPTIRAVSREDVFRLSDVVTVHLVLSDRSRGLIGATDLERMKKTAFFVNTSRGPLVVEQDLLQILMQGRIAGAALDVFDLEPLPSAHVWRVTRWGEDGRGEVLLAPHMGYVEKATFEAWYRMQANNVERWLKGEPLDSLIEAPKK